MQFFVQNKKTSNLGPKMPSVFSGISTIAIFEISTLNLSKWKFSCKKTFKLGTKNALFGYFGQQFYKTIAIFEINSFELVKTKFCAKITILKCGIKNALFGLL